MEFRDLKQQYKVLKPEIDKAVTDVMTNANFISGAEITELEKMFAEYVGVKHCITCGNGSDAITLACMAYGIGEGDAVFVPDFTFFATAECPAEQRATPVFVDIDKYTYNMDPQSLINRIEQTIKAGKLTPKAVIAVDLFGLCANYPEIEQICMKYGLILIEDGAQGFGGSINGKLACSFGDIATTSFFPAKPLGCYGDGGAIFTNDDEKNELIRSLCVHGKGKLGKYYNDRLGRNSRLDTMQAVILKVKLKAFVDYELADVNRVASYYDKYLKGRLVTPVIPDGFYSSWAQYTVQLKDEAQRGEIMAKLKAAGIPTMIYYPKLMSSQLAFDDIPYDGGNVNAEHAIKTVMQLPIHPYMTEDDVRNVCERLVTLL